MKKLFITLALVAAPALAAAQQPTQHSQQTPATAHDSTKAKPKTKTAHHAAATKKTGRSTHDTTKAKAAPDSSKKPS